MRKSTARIGALFIAALLLFLEVLLQSPSSKEEAQIEIAQESAVVTRVIDGDTLVVSIKGEEKTVRLIGLDTPETVDPGEGVECYGPEAAAALKGELLEGDSVVLISDETQDDKDRYGRLLRYVEEEGRDIGEWLIVNGYAEERVYDGSFLREEIYKTSEKQAQEKNLGMWGNACEDR